MNKSIRIITISFLVSLLAACASGATKEGMIYSQSESKLTQFDTALHHEVGVDSVNGGKDTNPVWISEIANDVFLGAVRGSLDSHGLLSDDGRYKLKIGIQTVDQPFFGLDFTVSTTVNYSLMDSVDRRMIFDETITTEHTATFSDSFYGVKRMRLANEGAARNNIGALLNLFAKLDIASGQVSLAPNNGIRTVTKNKEKVNEILDKESEPFINPVLGFSVFEGILGVEVQKGNHAVALGLPERLSYKYLSNPFGDSLFYGVFIGQYTIDDENAVKQGVLYQKVETTEYGFGLGYRWQWPSGFNVMASTAYMFSKDTYSNPGQSMKYIETFSIPFFPGIVIGYKF